MKAIFLDRDGTLNKDYGYIRSFNDFTLIPGTLEALKLLNEQGFSLFIVSNQSGVARGYFSYEEAENLNQKIVSYLKENGAIILDSRICPHHEKGIVEKYAKSCHCRKPNAGMLEDLGSKYALNFKSSYMVGDKISDAQTGNKLGVQGVLVNSGIKSYNEKKSEYPVFENLLAFARKLTA